MRKTPIIPGERYGRLVVLGEGLRCGGKRERSAVCLCDCGAETTASLSNLRSRHTKSCGCLHDEQAPGKLLTTHGMSRAPEYKVWDGMRHRCSNAANQDYGGRGISVCDRWLHSFENFFADMGARPSSGHSIDRINNDGNYEPGNCRWSTAAEQQRNRRTSKLTAGDVASIRARYATGLFTQAALAKEFGINSGYVCTIINRKRWRAA